MNFMNLYAKMGYYWVIGFNPLGFGLGWVIEGGTQNPMGWGSAEVYILLIEVGILKSSS